MSDWLDNVGIFEPALTEYEQLEQRIWAAVEGVVNLGPLNGMSVMLLSFEAWGIPVIRGHPEDMSYLDWRIKLREEAKTAGEQEERLESQGVTVTL